MQDAWRAYLELAYGLSEASKKKAKKVAKDLVGKGGATAAQVQSFTDDLLSTSRKNREGLARLVRYEVDRALGAVGLATSDEVGELTDRVRELERQVRETANHAPPAKTTATGTSSPAKKTTAKKTVAKKTAPTKAAKTTGATAAKTTGTRTTGASTTGTRTTAAKKTTAPAKATE